MKETLKNAFAQLWGNKLRTFLTMLGMLIGIGSVIIILSLGSGVKDYVSKQFMSFGKGTLQIIGNGRSTDSLITEEDLEVLKQIPEVTDVQRTQESYIGVSRDYLKKDKMFMIFGIQHNFEKVQSLNLKYGRMFTEQDESIKSNVIIVEDNFARIVYNKKDPKYALGKTIEISLGGEVYDFQIIGIGKSQYPAATPKEMIVPVVYMPFSTLNQYTMEGIGESYTAYITIDSDYKEADFIKPISRLMEKRHGGKKDLFSIQSLANIADSYTDIIDKVNIFTSVVAAISLIVGGIGIMNIMIVTVRERTREIGVRKALGATDGRILIQFLVESVIITVLGGLSGLLVGYIGGLMIGSLMNISATISLGMVIFSVGTSSIIGIVFGVYPAYLAAKLDPIEALRIE